jgi:hypothetical protein
MKIITLIFFVQCLRVFAQDSISHDQLGHNMSDAVSGNGTSGGGGAYVCRGSSNKILSAHIVDLWEAEHIAIKWHGDQGLAFRIPIDYTSTKTVDQIMADKLSKLASYNPIFADKVLTEYNYIKNNIIYLPSDVSIVTPIDLITHYFKTGCPAEGMMRYNGLINKLEINKDIFDMLATNADKAAAYLHESIYKAQRELYYPYFKNSILSRHLVGCLFSDNSCITQHRRNSYLKKYACYSHSLEFNLYTDEKPFDDSPDSNIIKYAQIEFKKIQGIQLDFEFYINSTYSNKISGHADGDNSNNGEMFGPLSNLGVYLGFVKYEIDDPSPGVNLGYFEGVEWLQLISWKYQTPLNIDEQIVCHEVVLSP